MSVKTDVLGEDGAKLHWIGKEDAQKVILYFHGASYYYNDAIFFLVPHPPNLGDGFITPLNANHITFMNNIRLRVKQNVNVDVKVAFLEYSTLEIFS